MDRVDTMFLEPARAFLVQIAAFLPRLAIALLVLVAGVLLAKAARFAVVKALRAINIHILTQRAGLDGALQRGGAEVDTVDLLGMLTGWVVVLIAAIVASNGLGLAQVSDLLGKLLLFVPKLVIALAIVALGAYFARFLGMLVQTYAQGLKLGEAEMLGRLARYGVLVVVLVLAVDQLDIGGALLRQSFLIVLGGLVFAVALAFGLGGREWAAARLESWWPSDAAKREPRDGAP
ncbi:MAG TPA: hypothetical protein VFR90_14610 [Methylibium sp.]|uniref:mechanosensitive ion channel family protein n=1 Tax=Methylibium sp. TaxID=2067992 RepID=UPI002DC01A0D|nr:hypothetical protein [Methylibium sp.]HEU4460349.1 hypothetical protein [Methylibium sp.]